MKPLRFLATGMIVLTLGLGSVQAQEEPTTPAETTQPAETETPSAEPETTETSAEAEPKSDTDETIEKVKETAGEVTETVKESTEEAVDYAKEKTEEIKQQVNASPQAKEYSAGILQPIYALAEMMSFSLFHWVAFTLMVSGVISFALQLVIGKLMVLIRGGFSILEILGDLQGLIISLIGLVLTTQAATENSTFTNNPFAVLSASVIGTVIGFMFYIWGQSEELQALRGRKEEVRIEKAKKG